MDDNEKKLRKELADLIFDGIELKDISYYEERYPKIELKQVTNSCGFFLTGSSIIDMFADFIFSAQSRIASNSLRFARK